MSSRRPKASTSRLPDAQPVISSTAPTRKLRKRPSTKGKERFVDPPAATDDDDSEEEWKPASEVGEKSKVKKGKGKRVRIAEPTEDEDSDSEGLEDFVSLSASPTSVGHRRRAGGEDTSDDGAPNADDYWDPRVLPVHQAQRRTRELRRLEYGGYRTALYDVSREEGMDLGRTLLEWEAIRRRKSDEESEEQQAEGSSRLDKLQREGKASRGGTPSEREDTPGTPAPGQTDKDVLPFPSARSLDILSRWPINPVVQETGDGNLTIEESLWSLVTSTKTKLERQNPSLRRPRPPPPRPRSAYDEGGPLATLPSSLDPSPDSPTSSAASDAESDLNSSDDDLPSSLSPSFNQLSTTLDTLLLQLAEQAPAGPPAPLDWFTQSKLWGNIKPKPVQQAVGWEWVLKVVKRMEGIPQTVAEQLEQRLIDTFGPPRPTTPPPSDDENDDEAPTSPTGDSVSPPPKKRKARAKSATATKEKGKRKADAALPLPTLPKRARKGSRAPSSSASASPALAAGAAPPPVDVDMADLPPLPELPPLPVMEEYRRQAYKSGDFPAAVAEGEGL